MRFRPIVKPDAAAHADIHGIKRQGGSIRPQAGHAVRQLVKVSARLDDRFRRVGHLDAVAHGDVLSRVQRQFGFVNNQFFVEFRVLGHLNVQRAVFQRHRLLGGQIAVLLHIVHAERRILNIHNIFEVYALVFGVRVVTRRKGDRSMIAQIDLFIDDGLELRADIHVALGCIVRANQHLVQRDASRGVQNGCAFLGRCFIFTVDRQGIDADIARPHRVRVDIAVDRPVGGDAGVAAVDDSQIVHQIIRTVFLFGAENDAAIVGFQIQNSVIHHDIAAQEDVAVCDIDVGIGVDKGFSIQVKQFQALPHDLQGIFQGADRALAVREDRHVAGISRVDIRVVRILRIAVQEAALIAFERNGDVVVLVFRIAQLRLDGMRVVFNAQG